MHSLTVITGSREISLASDQYTIENGRLLVPLRAFTESLGGKVEWDAKQRTGNAYYGGSHLSFDPVRKQVQVTREGGRPETLAMPDLGFINGSIYVPIREIASLYNYKIADYSVHENVRFVRLAEILTPELSFGQLYRNMNNSYAQAWLIVRQYLSSLTTIVAQWSLKFRWV